MAEFNRNTLQRNTDVAAQFLPDDPLFAAKNRAGSVLRRTMQGIAETFKQTEDFIVTYVEEYDLLQTEQFIDEWESAVSIPGPIFTTIEGLSLNERRNQVLILIRGNGAQVDQDFIDLAALAGYVVTIEHLQVNDLFIPPYNVPFCLGPNFEIGVYTWVVRGEDVEPFVPPYDVPFLPRSDTSVLSNLFNAFKPIHTKVCFANPTTRVQDPCPPVTCTLFTEDEIESIDNTFGANINLSITSGRSGPIILEIISLGLNDEVEAVNAQIFQQIESGTPLLIAEGQSLKAGDSVTFADGNIFNYIFTVQSATSSDTGGPITIKITLSGGVEQIVVLELCGCQGSVLKSVGPVTCPILTTDPGPPYDEDQNCYPSGPSPFSNVPVDGCTPRLFHGESCNGADSIDWRPRDSSGDTDPATLYNFYLFNGATGALIERLLSIPMPITSQAHFTQTNISAGAEFTFVMTGVTSADVSSISTQISVVHIL